MSSDILMGSCATPRHKRKRINAHPSTVMLYSKFLRNPRNDLPPSGQRFLCDKHGPLCPLRTLMSFHGPARKINGYPLKLGQRGAVFRRLPPPRTRPPIPPLLHKDAPYFMAPVYSRCQFD